MQPTAVAKSIMSALMLLYSQKTEMHVFSHPSHSWEKRLPMSANFGVLLSAPRSHMPAAAGQLSPLVQFPNWTYHKAQLCKYNKHSTAT